MVTRYDANRAYKLGKKIAAGVEISDVERAWLKQYKERAHANRSSTNRKPPPAVDGETIIAAVCARFGVSHDHLIACGRGGQTVDRARAVTMVVFRKAGASYSYIRAHMHRGNVGINKILTRARARPDILQDATRVLADITRSTPRGATEEVVTFHVVVGSPLWHALDKIEELVTLTEDALSHRVSREVRARRAGAE